MTGYQQHGNVTLLQQSSSIYRGNDKNITLVKGGGGPNKAENMKINPTFSTVTNTTAGVSEPVSSAASRSTSRSRSKFGVAKELISSIKKRRDADSVSSPQPQQKQQQQQRQNQKHDNSGADSPSTSGERKYSLGARSAFLLETMKKSKEEPNTGSRTAFTSSPQLRKQSQSPSSRQYQRSYSNNDKSSHNTKKSSQQQLSGKGSADNPMSQRRQKYLVSKMTPTPTRKNSRSKSAPRRRKLHDDEMSGSATSDSTTSKWDTESCKRKQAFLQNKLSERLPFNQKSSSQSQPKNSEASVSSGDMSSTVFTYESPGRVVAQVTNSASDGDDSDRRDNRKAKRILSPESCDDNNSYALSHSSMSLGDLNTEDGNQTNTNPPAPEVLHKSSNKERTYERPKKERSPREDFLDQTIRSRSNSPVKRASRSGDASASTLSYQSMSSSSTRSSRMKEVQRRRSASVPRRSSSRVRSEAEDSKRTPSSTRHKSSKRTAGDQQTKENVTPPTENSLQYSRSRSMSPRKYRASKDSRQRTAKSVSPTKAMREKRRSPDNYSGSPPTLSGKSPVSREEMLDVLMGSGEASIHSSGPPLAKTPSVMSDKIRVMASEPDSRSHGADGVVEAALLPSDDDTNFSSSRASRKSTRSRINEIATTGNEDALASMVEDNKSSPPPSPRKRMQGYTIQNGANDVNTQPVVTSPISPTEQQHNLNPSAQNRVDASPISLVSPNYDVENGSGYVKNQSQPLDYSTPSPTNHYNGGQYVNTYSPQTQRTPSPAPALVNQFNNQYGQPQNVSPAGVPMQYNNGQNIGVYSHSQETHPGNNVSSMPPRHIAHPNQHGVQNGNGYQTTTRSSSPAAPYLYAKNDSLALADSLTNSAASHPSTPHSNSLYQGSTYNTNDMQKQHVQPNHQGLTPAYHQSNTMNEVRQDASASRSSMSERDNPEILVLRKENEILRKQLENMATQVSESNAYTMDLIKQLDEYKIISGKKRYTMNVDFAIDPTRQDASGGIHDVTTRATLSASHTGSTASSRPSYNG